MVRNDAPVSRGSATPAIAKRGPLRVLRRLVRERSWKELQWPVLGVLGFIAIVLGTIGYSQLYGAHGYPRQPWDLLYRDIQLFAFSLDDDNHPLPVALEIARWLAPFVAGYTALLTLYNVFRRRFRQMRLPFTQGHVVICGLGEKGLLFARPLLDERKRVVVIERDPANEHLELCEHSGAAVLIGDAREPQLLRQARISDAAHLIVVGDDDGVNVEITSRAAEITARDRSPRIEALTCLTHLFDGDRASLLRARELNRSGNDRFHLDFFSVNSAGAFKLVERFPPQGEPPHVLVAGQGPLIEWIVVSAAQRWMESPPAGGRPSIALVDPSAGEQVAQIGGKYPQLEQTVDLHAISSPVDHSESVRHALGPIGDTTHVYVSQEDDSAGLSAALSLRNHVIDPKVPIVIAMTRVKGLARLLDSGAAESSGLGPIEGFSLLEETCVVGHLLSHSFEVYAHASHDDYCEKERQKGETPETNPSIRPFDELPPESKEQNRSQAADVGDKLRLIGCTIVPRRDWTAAEFTFTDDEIELLSKREHQRYVDLALAQGYRYAPGPKDAVARTNPTLVPWEELSEMERDKDRDVVRKIPKILARIGLQVIRVDTKAGELSSPSST